MMKSLVFEGVNHPYTIKPQEASEGDLGCFFRQFEIMSTIVERGLLPRKAKTLNKARTSSFNDWERGRPG